MSFLASCSIVSPVGYSASTCGYCSPPGLRSSAKTSQSFGLWAHDLSPGNYQELIDRGWRRSGNYVYKPDLCRTCCKQYAIRLNVSSYRIGGGARKAMKRCVDALKDGLGEEQRGTAKNKEPRALTPRASASRLPVSEASYHSIWGKGEGKYSQPSDLEGFFGSIAGDASKPTESQTIAQAHKQRQEAAIAWRRAKKEQSNKSVPCPTQPPFSQSTAVSKHTLSARLHYGSSSAEKYELFRRYQMSIHKESSSKVSSRQGFERFLCESSLRRDMPQHLSKRGQQRVKPRQQISQTELDLDGPEALPYGLYHLEWLLDDQHLIAVSVIDILPHCVSAVYFFYDPAYEKLELGKISALREIYLVKQLQKKVGMEKVKWYYLGFYIHNRQKMKYKAQYSPSQILDGSTYQWWDYNDVKEKVDRGQSYDFHRTSDDPSNVGPRPLSDTESQKTKAAERCDHEFASDPGSESEDSDDSEPSSRYLPPNPRTPGILDPLSLNPLRLAQEVLVLDAEDQSRGIAPACLTSLVSALLHPEPRAVREEDRPTKEHEARLLRDVVAAVGWQLATGRSDESSGMEDERGDVKEQGRFIFFV